MVWVVVVVVDTVVLSNTVVVAVASAGTTTAVEVVDAVVVCVTMGVPAVTVAVLVAVRVLVEVLMILTTPPQTTAVGYSFGANVSCLSRPRLMTCPLGAARLILRSLAKAVCWLAGMNPGEVGTVVVGVTVVVVFVVAVTRAVCVIMTGSVSVGHDLG